MHWERNGLCLWSKRVEKQQFIRPRSIAGEMAAMSGRELNALLDGFDVWVAVNRSLDVRRVRIVSDNSHYPSINVGFVVLSIAPACDTSRMLETSSCTDPEAHIAQLESLLSQRKTEIEARDLRSRSLEEALRVLQADRYGASREKLGQAPGQRSLFN